MRITRIMREMAVIKVAIELLLDEVALYEI